MNEYVTTPFIATSNYVYKINRKLRNFNKYI